MKTDVAYNYPEAKDKKEIFRRIIRNIKLSIAGMFFMFSFASCELLGIDPDVFNLDFLDQVDLFGPKQLETEDAKIEMEAASSEVSDTKDIMLECTGFSTLNYLMELESGSSFKSGAKSALIFDRENIMEKILRITKENNGLKSATNKVEDDEDLYGIFEWDFYEEEFVKKSESETIYRLIFPADETLKSKKQLNAELTIDKLQYVEILSTDEIGGYTTPENYPTSADLMLKVNNVTELTGSFDAGYNETGKATSIDASLESCEYYLDMSLSGSGTDYKSSLSFKMGNELKLGYDMKIKYTSDLEDTESIKGTITMSPVEYDCDIKVKAITDEIDRADENDTDPDVDVLNSNLKVDVIQIDQKAKIGTVELEEYTDPEWGDTEIRLVVVYKDGSSEELKDIFPFLDEE